MTKRDSSLLRLLMFMACVLLCAGASATQLDFRQAIDLALKRSGTMAIAAADQLRARQAYMEARNQYIPQVTFGSGIAYSAGFPLSLEGSAPSVFNVTSQSFLLNSQQKEFIHAAKLDWLATSTSSADKRGQVILDTAVAYTQLDTLTSQLALMEQQQQAAARQQQIVEQRVNAGVDNALELTKAKLTAAHVRMRMAELHTAANVLRSRLASLTGIPADELETVTESVPDLPMPGDSDLVSKALDTSAVLKAANQQAEAKEVRARGEGKYWYPTIDAVGQYGLFSRYNNYDEFFRKFQRNNATLGVVIRFPLFNGPLKARAEGAAAEAIKARKEAEGVRQQVSEETINLQGTVRQLAAARDVAKLEYDLARGQGEAIQVQVQSGMANLRQQQEALLNENEKYNTLLDVTFQLEKTQIQLLKATGELETWAMK
jgi:outer membrane protein TolC